MTVIGYSFTQGNFAMHYNSGTSNFTVTAVNGYLLFQVRKFCMLIEFVTVFGDGHRLLPKIMHHN